MAESNNAKYVFWGVVVSTLGTIIVASINNKKSEEPPKPKTEQQAVQQQINNTTTIYGDNKGTITVNSEQIGEGQAKSKKENPKLNIENKKMVIDRPKQVAEKNEFIEPTEFEKKTVIQTPINKEFGCVFSDNEGEIQYFEAPQNHIQPKGWLKQGTKVVVIKSSIDKTMLQIEISDKIRGWIPKEKIQSCN